MPQFRRLLPLRPPRFFLIFCVLGLTLPLWPQQSTRPVTGVVVDSLGRPLVGAGVTLLASGDRVLAQTTSGADGRFQLTAGASAASLAVTRSGFAAARESIPAGTAPVLLTVTLGLSPTQQTINVAAVGVGIPTAQLGSSTSTVTADELRRLDPLIAADALRFEPGLVVSQSGQAGAVTTLFLRGSPSDFTAVLIDGIPVQRIDFDGYDFSELAPVGTAEMQTVRGPDSVIYGSDAAAGVVAIESERGDQVAAPELVDDTEAGPYATVVQSDQALGTWRQFDYALGYGYLDTHNQQPNSRFRSSTYNANLGWQATSRTAVRLTLWRDNAFTGQPNARLFYGIADDSFQDEAETNGGLDVDQAMSSAWHLRLTASQSDSHYLFDTPAPAGYVDAYGDYLGLPVTIQGANGYSVTGQAILDFGGVYPSLFASDTLRRNAGAESSYQLGRHWNWIVGYRYYNELGLTAAEQLSRHDNGAYSELTGGLWSRVFGSVGLSWDRNTPFGSTASPQASLAAYLRRDHAGFWNETRVRTSGGAGLKDPSISEQASSLYQQLLALPGGSAQAAHLGIGPIAPQRSRDFDAGLDQFLLHDRVAFTATAFDQRYYNVIENVPASAFPLVGLPPAVATLEPFGADYNSLTESAKGTELSLRARFTSGWHFGLAYTWMLSQVLRSDSGDAVAPAANPLFPSIPIGAYAPLVGARPFRLPPESGSVEAGYEHGRVGVDLNAWVESRRDDSTFLTDANYGDTMLLPNHDLDPAFGVVNLTGYFRLRPRVRLQAAIDNLFNQTYQEVLGYPSPGISARLGVELNLPAPWYHAGSSK